MGQNGRIYIAASQGRTDHLAPELIAFLHGRRKARRARTFGDVVGVGVEVAHGLCHFNGLEVG